MKNWRRLNDWNESERSLMILIDEGMAWHSESRKIQMVVEPFDVNNWMGLAQNVNMSI